MHLHFHRLSLRFPFPAHVLEFAHQFLLFGVDGHDRLLLLLEPQNSPADVLKLGIAILVGGAFPSLPVGLQAIACGFQ
jgi:hypothetical protein